MQATVLVVDDTPDNLTLMSGLLKDQYRVKVANGGERASSTLGGAAIRLGHLVLAEAEGIWRLAPRRLRRPRESERTGPALCLFGGAAAGRSGLSVKPTECRSKTCMTVS
jgi:CheY-like chemotaxis protein